ncbi:hypothetical protein TNCV_4022521 [Trichonephila clavipes]|nr:hypothetical protein TNCV_4022521 [Trichonephila clavipes]
MSRAQTSFRRCGVVVRRGGYQLRCHPHHLTMVQNYVVRPQKALDGPRNFEPWSSDVDEKLRGPSPKSPHAAEVYDVNIHSLTCSLTLRKIS